MAHDIFLSYSRQDSEMMVRMSRDLRAAGFTVWTDEGIEPGAPSWKMEIERAISDAALLVVLLSPDAAQSKWVRAEIDYAETREKPLYPVLVRGDMKTAVPFGMSAHQFIDFRELENYAASLQKLADALTKRLQTEPRTVTPQVAPSKRTTPSPPRKRTLWLALVVAVLIVVGSGVAYWAFSQQGETTPAIVLDDDSYTLEGPSMVITLPLEWAGTDGEPIFEQFLLDYIPNEQAAQQIRDSLLIEGQWTSTGNIGTQNFVAMGRLDFPLTPNRQLIEGFVLRLWGDAEAEFTEFMSFEHPVGPTLRAAAIPTQDDSNGLVSAYYLTDTENRDLYWVLFLTTSYDTPRELFAVTDQLIEAFRLADAPTSE